MAVQIFIVERCVKMIGFNVKINMLNAWGMIDAERYLHESDEQQESAIDAMIGMNGTKIQRELSSYGNKRGFNSCLARYATETRNKKARIENGYVTHMVTQQDKNEGAAHAIVDSAAKYIETEFDNILNDESLDELMHEFALVRKHILFEKNYDLSLLMINAANEEENDDTLYAKTVLSHICRDYELHDFMQNLLSCKGAFERIKATV